MGRGLNQWDSEIRNAIGCTSAVSSLNPIDSESGFNITWEEG